ncbi:MAG: DUF373 family protein [Candidatus Diapherotrites archaeon]|nr:DUF373 family protein [Candidatus Diapherotrites archaeon]
MAETKHILIVCIDRDDDLGRKTGIQGPVLGRKNVLNAAARLAVTDPYESDANCMFAAVNTYDEITKNGETAEVCVLTGVDKTDYQSDKRISEQLDDVFAQFPADGIVLVTDGAEDDQVIPILQSKSRIISKKTVIVRQAKEVESTFYSIKEALKDNSLKTMFIILPGVILLLLAALPAFSFSIVAGSIGIFLLFYGFGLYERVQEAADDLTNSIAHQHTSFPFYLASFFVLVFAAITIYTQYTAIAQNQDPVTSAVSAAQTGYFLVFLAAESFLLAKSLDAAHLRKAYKLVTYFSYATLALLSWLILDAGTDVFLKRADIDWFLRIILISAVILWLTLRSARLIDIRTKVTDFLIGVSVYNPKGEWLGKIEKTYPAKQLLEFTNQKTKQLQTVNNNAFRFRENKIVLVK